jgi:hypothetical protein
MLCVVPVVETDNSNVTLALHSNIIIKTKSTLVNLQCPKISKFFGLTNSLLRD